MPQSSRNDIDYLFCLPSAKALHAFDAGYNTGVMAFTADGTNPAELDSFIMLDESYFKSNKAGQIGKILSGMETDSVTPVDAGAPNQVFALTSSKANQTLFFFYFFNFFLSKVIYITSTWLFCYEKSLLNWLRGRLKGSDLMVTCVS